jgi:F-type H+-transporting ATPase subunit b
MFWARASLCVAILGFALAPCLAEEATAAVKGELTHAETELEHAVQTDPSHPASASSDPLGFDPDLAIFTLIVFILLLVVLKKFAWGPILQSLETREHNIADQISEADRNHREARALLAEYEQRLAAATGEVRELMEAARREAEHAKQAILAEAKTAAEAERERSLREIEAAADSAMESLAERSAQLAVELAGKILKSKLTADDQARLIQEAMAKFPASSVN